MDKYLAKLIVKNVVDLLMDENLLEISDDISKEDYDILIDDIRDNSMKKFAVKLQKLLPKDTETLLKEKMKDGFNIGIECKGKGREYEMTFEGTASNLNTPFNEKVLESFNYHGVGNSIEELLNSMFNKNDINKYKKK